jgi:hypothetical protein
MDLRPDARDRADGSERIISMLYAASGELTRKLEDILG